MTAPRPPAKQLAEEKVTPVRQVMDGNTAVAYGARLSRVQVVAAYPITPQSTIAEVLASFCDEGSLNARYLRVESEHSAMSATVGASYTGVRAFTATASVGLALMMEVIGVAAGSRLPIVMAVANRALCSPWSLWCDHSDTMAMRDQGWIQMYAENCQEALDFVPLAYRIAEDPLVQLPAVVAIDGFFLSHMSDTVEIPEQEKVDSFLPPRGPGLMRMDPAAPVAANVLTGPPFFTEAKYPMAEAMERVPGVAGRAMAEFGRVFGRQYAQVVAYRCEDADTALVAMGSVCGTVHHVVDKLRSQGRKVGLLRLVMFRPFPYDEVRAALVRAKNVIVLDRTPAVGTVGPLQAEVRTALYGTNPPPEVSGFVAGIGGRDIPEATVLRAMEEALAAASAIGRAGPAFVDAPALENWVDVIRSAPAATAVAPAVVEVKSR